MCFLLAGQAPARQADAEMEGTPLLITNAHGIAGGAPSLRVRPFAAALDAGQGHVRWTNVASMSTGQGSTANVIAALASFFIAGLGQLIQGRVLAAALFFLFASILWIFYLGWIIHLWSVVDAALWKRKN